MLRKFIVASLVLSTGVYANYYSNQNTSSPSYTNQANYGNPGISDQELAKKVRDKVDSAWSSKYDQISVFVNNGMVTLQGSVPTWKDKDNIEKAIRNLEGVRGLNSHITVQDPSSHNNQQKQFPQDRAATPIDDQLNKKIRDNISRGWLWDSYKEIALNTNNGVVTLEGVIDNMDDQKKLISDIQKIEGVKSVRSALRVKNPS